MQCKSVQKAFVGAVWIILQCIKLPSDLRVMWDFCKRSDNTWFTVMMLSVSFENHPTFYLNPMVLN